MFNAETDCASCGNQFVKTECTPGYGEVNGRKLCYDCCALEEHGRMAATGRATLYFVVVSGNRGYGEVTDWPGKLRFDISSLKKSRHNIAGKRYDFWFMGPHPTGVGRAQWHGYTIGDNTQIAHCKRLKMKLA